MLEKNGVPHFDTEVVDSTLDAVIWTICALPVSYQRYMTALRSWRYLSSVSLLKTRQPDKVYVTTSTKKNSVAKLTFIPDELKIFHPPVLGVHFVGSYSSPSIPCSGDFHLYADIFSRNIFLWLHVELLTPLAYETRRFNKGSPIIPILRVINPIPRIDTYIFNIRSVIFLPPRPKQVFPVSVLLKF